MPDNDTPSSESQPAASATPSPVPASSKQPPSLKEALNEARGGFAKLNKEEKTGCGCGIMFIVALCFLLGKCSCSETPAGNSQTSSAPLEVSKSNVVRDASTMERESPGKAVPEQLYQGGHCGIFDAVDSLRSNSYDPRKLQQEIIVTDENDRETWFVDNLAGDHVIYSYRTYGGQKLPGAPLIRIAVLREQGRFYAEDSELETGRFRFLGIEPFLSIQGVEMQIPAFMSVGK